MEMFVQHMDGFTLLYHVANFAAFVSFLLRDQLKLRLLMAVSLVLQGLYYFMVPSGPLWDPLFWKVVSTLANGAMILFVFRDRLHYGIADHYKPLFDRISVLSPGQFRKLTGPAFRTVGDGSPILTKGAPADHLFFLLEGRALVAKDGATVPVASGAFLGEIAFLTGCAATATVTLESGAQCLVWKTRDLRALMAKDAALDIAMRGLFNHDLARKVSNSALMTAEGHAIPWSEAWG